MEPATIVARAPELAEGLFGGVVLFILETLPGLEAAGHRPDWRIDAACYGNVVPTILEPVDPIPGPERSLVELRSLHRRAIGGDFASISTLWHSRFRPAPTVVAAADHVDPGLGNALGVHYRGGDKLRARWDTNPIGRDDFLDLVEDRLATGPAFDRCLVTGDDPAFIERAIARLPIPVSTPGAGESHRTGPVGDDRSERAMLAFRDCLLLSRCRAILQTSSALPSFAKVLRPEVDCRRCAASKWFGEVPYFPVAHVPRHRPSTDRLRVVVDRAMTGDWLDEPEADPSFSTVADRPWTSVARPSRAVGRLGRLRERVVRLFPRGA